ncbi:MAG: G5 domain-containing protein [Candidatus Moraniibacteriota bacterium]
MINKAKKDTKKKIYLLSPLFLAAGLMLFNGSFFPDEVRTVSFSNSSKKVTLKDAGFSYQTFTEADTVKDFLEEKNLEVDSQDEIAPGLEEEIYPGFKIVITRKYEVDVKVDGGKKSSQLEKMTVAQALKEMDISLSELDEVSPARDKLIRDEVEIEVTRIKEKEVTESFDIDYETITKEDDDLKWGKTKVEQEGAKGIREVDYLLRYENGELITKEKIQERIAEKPVPKVVVKGTKIEIGEIQRGIASWYEYTNDLKCASVKFPKGTWLRVRNQENGKEVIVQVNDYGPSPETGKIIDLDKKAFEKIANPWDGVVEVKVEEIL